MEDEPIPGIAFEYRLHRQLAPSVTVDEINRLAREWLVDRNRVILVTAPEKADVTVPSAAELLAVFDAVERKEVAPYKDGAADALLIAVSPTPSAIVSEEHHEEIDVTEWRLANGVRVLLKPTDYQDDEVVLRATSPGGHSLVDDRDFLAAATATTVVGQGGLGDLSLIDLQKVLAGQAAWVTPFISQSSEGLSGSASTKDLLTMFQLIYLYFTAPRMDQSAFTAFEQRARASLENAGANPRAVFQDTVAVTMSQHHHRTRPLTVELLSELDLETSFKVYRDRFADASDFSFVFVGNFDVDSMRMPVEAYLGGLPSLNRDETWADPGIDPPAGVIRKTVRRGVEPQSQTQIIFTGDAQYTRDNRYAMQSMTRVLRTWLRETLREQLGGTYGVSVSGSISRFPKERYRLTIAFGSAPERAEELAATVFHHIDSLRTTCPTVDDILKVQESQRRGRETNMRRNEYWVGQLIGHLTDGTNPRQILRGSELIDGLDAAMVRSAAQRFFDLENYVHAVLLPALAGGS